MKQFMVHNVHFIMYRHYREFASRRRESRKYESGSPIRSGMTKKYDVQPIFHVFFSKQPFILNYEF